MNIEASSKLWILCCVCCCGNTGQRLFCVIQCYCINIPEYVRTIAAHTIMLLFNWKLIKYINKNSENSVWGFFLPPTVVIESIYLYFKPISWHLRLFLHLIVDALKTSQGHKTLLACPIWHVASQISLSLLLHHHFFFFFTLSKSWALHRDLDSQSVCLSPTMHLEGTWPSRGLSERLLALLPWGGRGADSGDVPLYLSVTQTEAGPLMASPSRAF